MQKLTQAFKEHQQVAIHEDTLMNWLFYGPLSYLCYALFLDVDS
jgi:hypothetical protein